MNKWITRKRIDFTVWRLRRKAGKTKPTDSWSGKPYQLPLAYARVWEYLNENDRKTWELARTAQYLLDLGPLPAYDLTGRGVTEEQMKEIVDRGFGFSPSFVEREIRADKQAVENPVPYEPTRLVTWWDSGLTYEGKYGTAKAVLKLINGVPEHHGRPMLPQEQLALDQWYLENPDAQRPGE